MTAVDVEAAAHAIESLVASSELRAQMGAEGSKHARSVYDWSAVIPRHEKLWRHQMARRPSARDPAVNPHYPDPLSLFAHYPTRRLSRTDLVTLQEAGGVIAEQCRDEEIVGRGIPGLHPVEWSIIEDTLSALKAGALTIDALADSLGDRRHDAQLCVAWLAKIGAVVITPTG